jgi:hypothetical protein
MDEATEQLDRADADLARCKALQSRQPAEEANPMVQRLGTQLQEVYSHLWKLQISEGLGELWVSRMNLLCVQKLAFKQT